MRVRGSRWIKIIHFSPILMDEKKRKNHLKKMKRDKKERQKE